MSQLARVVELLLQLPQQSPARLRCHVLRSCRSVACADKAHTVKGDGVAEACAVRTHAACTSTLVALRPPLRVCEPFFKISFLALGSRSTSGSCRVQTTATRCDCELVDHKSYAPIDSAAWATYPDHPSLTSACAAHHNRRRAPGVRFATSPFFRRDRHNSQSREGVSCAAVLPGKTGPPVPVLHPGRRGGYKAKFTTTGHLRRGPASSGSWPSWRGLMQCQHKSVLVPDMDRSPTLLSARSMLRGPT